ncbi:MAG: hypothetical protein RR333_05415 [Bacteroidales bacterium]
MNKFKNKKQFIFYLFFFLLACIRFNVHYLHAANSRLSPFSSLSSFFFEMESVSSQENLIAASLNSLQSRSTKNEIPPISSNASFHGRIAFYNVENLFDYFHDTTKKDKDFTPMGLKAWGKKKYEQKCINLFKVISDLNSQNSLIAIGLAEVENDKVLRDLILGTPLRYEKYAFIHYESADPRGIDVAFLYDSSCLHIIESCAIPIIYPLDTLSYTRDILYVKARLFLKRPTIKSPSVERLSCIEKSSSTEVPFPKEEQSKISNIDTIHFFVLHFPSKYAGALSTDYKRRQAGFTLRSAMDSISKKDPKASIIVMGDFNGEPQEESLRESIGFDCISDISKESTYLNLMCSFQGKEGSNKFHESWSIIDHFIINKSLLEHIRFRAAYLFKPSYLLMPDPTYLGQKTFRTFYGPKYLGGYSDHLPIYLDLEMKQEEKNLEKK